MSSFHCGLSFFLLIALAACSNVRDSVSDDDGRGVPAEQITIQQQFANSLSNQDGKFSLVEQSSEAKQDGYIKLFDTENTSHSPVTKSAHFYLLANENLSITIDLAIYRLGFKSEKFANEFANKVWGAERSGTIADGKVLTRYAVSNSGSVVVVLRTQDILDPDTTRFFEGFANN